VGWVCPRYWWVEFKSYAFDALSIISNARSGLNLLKSVWWAVRHLPLQLQQRLHMRYLLAFKPIAGHMSFDFAKLCSCRRDVGICSIFGTVVLDKFASCIASWTVAW
jgi:hypothetical protein